MTVKLVTNDNLIYFPIEKQTPFKGFPKHLIAYTFSFLSFTDVQCPTRFVSRFWLYISSSKDLFDVQTKNYLNKVKTIRDRSFPPTEDGLEFALSTMLAIVIDSDISLKKGFEALVKEKRILEAELMAVDSDLEPSSPKESILITVASSLERALPSSKKLVCDLFEDAEEEVERSIESDAEDGLIVSETRYSS